MSIPRVVIALAVMAAAMACDGDGSGGDPSDAARETDTAPAPSTDAAPEPTDAQDLDGPAAEPADGAPPDGTTPDATRPDAAPLPDAAPDARPIDTAELRTALEQALAEAPAGVEGMTLLVFDANDTRLIDISVGDSAADRRMPVASASKMVSALVFLRLVEEGALNLDDTPAARLGWQGPFAGVTLDMLNAFTSGMPGDALCTGILRMTLADCAANFEDLEPLGAPGAVYDYGSTHQHVAAAMAQAATGELWDALFRRTIAEPLGLLDPALRYVTRPQQGEGTDNPLIAGGLIATPEEYARILSLVFHRGALDGAPHIAPALIDRMGENHYPEAVIEGSPAQIYGFDYYYGFGSWLECDGPVATCDVISSPGAFGFTPWVDWGRGYYGILAMDRGQQGGARYSMETVDRLEPLIHAALGR